MGVSSSQEDLAGAETGKVEPNIGFQFDGIANRNNTRVVKYYFLLFHKCPGNKPTPFLTSKFKGRVTF
jgi:hypothetical protein